MLRVITYIDGFNLYYGLRSKGWRFFYWLNIQEMAQRMLKPHQTLVGTKYFTSIVNLPSDKHERQTVFLDALGTLSDFGIYYGHYLADVVTCRQCGHTHRTHHEKMTDVNIAVEMMSDAFLDKFDVALLVWPIAILLVQSRQCSVCSAKSVSIMAFPPESRLHNPTP